MQNIILITRIFIKLLIAIGLLCSILSHVVILISWIIGITIPKYIAIMFCIGTFTSVGINIYDFIKAKKQDGLS